MVRLIILFLLLVPVVNYGQKIKPPGTLHYLSKFDGRFPTDVKLLTRGTLSNRLKALLKKDYVFVRDTWAVEEPIQVTNQTFKAWGCQQHNCSNTNFIIVVDFTKNLVYAGIREEESIKVYSEDGSSDPEVTKWANRN
jgi:hypothetical protein